MNLGTVHFVDVFKTHLCLKHIPIIPFAGCKDTNDNQKKSKKKRVSFNLRTIKSHLFHLGNSYMVATCKLLGLLKWLDKILKADVVAFIYNTSFKCIVCSKLKIYRRMQQNHPVFQNLWIFMKMLVFKNNERFSKYRCTAAQKTQYGP